MSEFSVDMHFADGNRRFSAFNPYVDAETDQRPWPRPLTDAYIEETYCCHLATTLDHGAAQTDEDTQSQFSYLADIFGPENVFFSSFTELATGEERMGIFVNDDGLRLRNAKPEIDVV